MEARNGSSEELSRAHLDVTVDTVREGEQTYKREIVHHRAAPQCRRL